MVQRRRRICFVTGTRAEFGLMGSALRAIRGHPKLALRIVATGMHLDPAHGRTLDQIRGEGWTVDRLVPWLPGGALAANVGGAVAALSSVLSELDPDIVLVVGDRVEAFAGATAGYLGARVVAHVHGGDRALGQVDDSLRHAITKLSHVHFPATARSAKRLARLGEDPWRIRLVGSPGIDGIVAAATPRRQLARRYPDLEPRRYALLLLHPTDADEAAEHARARMLLDAVKQVGLEKVFILYPNNDPGSAGIIRAWQEAEGGAPLRIERDVARADFLGLLRDAALLAGNSSSGIIEAASFGTPVLDAGDRQAGRERSANARHVPFEPVALRQALGRVWNNGRPQRWTGKNVYGGRGAGRRMAQELARITLDAPMRRKLISY